MFNLNEGIFHMLTVSAEWQKWAIEILFVLAVIVVSYLLGSINSAIIISKFLYKDDIRKYGSGNAGMTNMLRTFGKRAALFTLLGDLLKTALAVLFAGVLFGFRYVYGISMCEYCYVAGLFAVLGHVFPIYYKFKGGKGVLATSTMALILTPIPFAILLLVFIAIVGTSKYVSLGSVCVATLYPVLVAGYAKFLGMPTPGIMMLSCILLAIFIVWCHRENLRRISERTERKISFGKGKKEKIDEKSDDAE
ncbi:MAG: glycerol-3-phosphate 1-O-acyltransferase PlsY [Clostridia bacterium]|nr:glycerol-3-phosphate 1-O-acyltransferase PlsY [Clostridia bacterium]